MLNSKLTNVVSLLCIVLCATLPSIAQTAVPPVTTTAAVIEYAHSAENDPLAPAAALQRKEAMSFAENDHTTHVLLCAQVLSEIQKNRAANAHEVSLQYVVSAAAFLYGHPEAATDSLAQNIAGIEAALNVYEAFVRADGKSRSKFLDTLQKQRTDGKLKEYLAHLCK